MESFLLHRKLSPMKQKTLRRGLHCCGLEGCRYGNPPQAENPASKILVYY